MGEYAQHRPEQTLPYQLLGPYVTFVEHLAARARALPAHVQPIAPGDFVCPPCGACRVAEGATLLIDEVVPREPSEHGNRTVETEFEVVGKTRLRYAPDAVR